MRFEFKAAPTGGIRLIPEIPDQRLCRLEGLNGIGKTLAVRLLELSTGQQPYGLLPAAWTSLKSNLGPSTIMITGLDNHESLVIALSPDSWGAKPEDPGTLGRAYLDGVEIPFDQVPSVLSVVRIAGDQTLAAQIQQRIQADAKLAELYSARAEERLRDLEGMSSRVLDLVRPFSLVTMRHVDEAAHDAARGRRDAQSGVTTAAGRFRELAEVDDLEQARQRIVERAPKLESDIAESDGQLRAMDARRADLIRRRDELLPSAQAAEVVLRQIRRLGRLQERQTEQSRQIRGQADSLSQSLEISAEATAVARATVDIQAQVQELADRRKSFALLPELDTLLRRIEAALDESASALPDSEVIAVVGSANLSVADLRLGLETRRAELARLQAFAALSEIDAELSQLRSRRQRLGELSTLLSESRKLRDRLARTEASLREAFERARQNASEQYGAIIRDVEALEKERLAVIERRATLRYSLGLLQSRGSAEDLDARISKARSVLGVAGSTKEAKAAASETLELAKRHASEAEEMATAAASARTQFTRRLRESIDALVGDSSIRNVIELAGLKLPAAEAPDEEYLAVFERMTAALERLQLGIDAAVIEGGALTGNLTILAGLVGRGVAEIGPALGRLATHYDQIVGELLSRKEMQNALFRSGEFRSIDLLQGEVAWTTPEGELRRRPLEAFSSGESAFAYVLASAISKTQPDARNRLLVLDEFGAFIEAGKMQDLLAFLSRDVLDAGRADQVVVILPLRDASEEPALGDRGYMTVEERP